MLKLLPTRNKKIPMANTICCHACNFKLRSCALTFDLLTSNLFHQFSREPWNGLPHSYQLWTFQSLSFLR